MLFLNVMAPLNEVHRFIDEAHESSLRVGDLIELLSEPDRPLVQAGRAPRARTRRGEPVLVAEDLEVDVPDADGKPRPALRRGLA